MLFQKLYNSRLALSNRLRDQQSYFW